MEDYVSLWCHLASRDDLSRHDGHGGVASLAGIQKSRSRSEGDFAKDLSCWYVASMSSDLISFDRPHNSGVKQVSMSTWS